MASTLVITYKKNIWGIPAWIPFIKKEHKCTYLMDTPMSDQSPNQEVYLAQQLNKALVSNRLGDNITQVDVRFHDGVLFINTSHWANIVFNVDASAPIVLYPFTRFNSFNTTASVDFSRAKIFQVKHFGYHVDVCSDANLERLVVDDGGTVRAATLDITTRCVQAGKGSNIITRSLKTKIIS